MQRTDSVKINLFHSGSVWRGLQKFINSFLRRMCSKYVDKSHLWLTLTGSSAPLSYPEKPASFAGPQSVPGLTARV
ncbi:hypothetical protein [Candidatus Pantoea persica]|uniref:hypothetical protein n=1 Tax=Candidatus Pantoea persica TaxID=2518128 RepID=UPI00215DB7AD|nr:hypothetical protein [Candidatus Pantoea persica]